MVDKTKLVIVVAGADGVFGRLLLDDEDGDPGGEHVAQHAQLWALAAPLGEPAGG
jgi:hypothetical protein